MPLAVACCFLLSACGFFTSREEELTERALENGWSLEAEAVPEDTGDREEAEKMADWLASFSYQMSHEVEYSGFLRVGEGFERLAEDYPLPESSVPEGLLVAKNRLDEAEVFLEARQMGDAEAALQAAALALAQLEEPLLADWVEVETRTGARILNRDIASGFSTTDRVEVLEWIDGDTLRTDEGIVRLIGLDAPEISDDCSLALDARDYAELLAPKGTDLTVSSPFVVNDRDRHGRMLRYLETTSDQNQPVDVGYSLILSGLAKARFDSRDGYQWHPRELAYRVADVSSENSAPCEWGDAMSFAALETVGDDNDETEQERSAVRESVIAGIHSAATLPSLVASAREYHAERDRWQAEWDDREDSSSGGSTNIPGWLCPTRWC